MKIEPEAWAKHRPMPKRDHLAFALRSAAIHGDVLECGVFMGRTIKLLADIIKPETVHGFDSWEGLPEDWRVSNALVRPQGHFAIPECDRPKLPHNVRMWIGEFHRSLYWYLHERAQPVRFLHVDCDLYQSAKDVLFALNERIIKGTIIAFDELCNWPEGEQQYTEWREGEHKALNEWLTQCDRYVQPFARNDEYGASIYVLR